MVYDIVLPTLYGVQLINSSLEFCFFCIVIYMVIMDNAAILECYFMGKYGVYVGV